MILPHPESDLSTNILVVSGDIIKILSSRTNSGSFVLTENVLLEFLKRSEKRTPEMFLNALTFLFAFDIIERSDYKIRLNPKTRDEGQIKLFN